jgi:hypothetical protein
VLLLWDRILGFDNLELLSVLAASVFDFRANSLMKARTRGEVEVIFLIERVINTLTADSKRFD